MLASIGFDSMEALVKSTVPPDILTTKELALAPPLTESEALHKIKQYAAKNKVMKSYIGVGYYDTQVPPVILRNMLENPGWYTAYTPYQAEISQVKSKISSMWDCWIHLVVYLIRFFFTGSVRNVA